MSGLELYVLLVILPGLGLLSGLIFLLCFVVGLLLLPVLAGDAELEGISTPKLVKALLITAAISGTLLFSLPTEKAMLTIITIKYISNNQDISKLPAVVLRKLEETK